MREGKKRVVADISLFPHLLVQQWPMYQGIFFFIDSQ
jgi:hypothetical protein